MSSAPNAHMVYIEKADKVNIIDNKALHLFPKLFVKI